MIDTGIYELITANAAAIGLVGGLHPNVLPKEPQYPAATYMEVGGSSQPTFETLGPQRERWQFDIFGQDRKSTMAVYWAFRLKFEGFRGVLPDGSVLTDMEHIERQTFFDDLALSYRVMSEWYLHFTL